MLLSALLHPIRDLTLKGTSSPAFSYLAVSIIWIVIAGTHAILSGQGLGLPTAAWPFAIVSGIGLAIYYYGTLAALRRGNLSVYYPIIRSSPLAIVVFNWILLGQTYAVTTLAGIGVIIWAGLAIQKAPGGFFDDWRAFGLALLAMIASAAFAIADAHAMRYAAPATFLFWVYGLVTILLLVVYLIECRHERSGRPIWPALRRSAIMRILLASVSSYASYYLVLMAFQRDADPAVVSAVRQASIPVSVILAAVILHEPRFLQRMGWATVLAAGIILIVTG